MAKGVTIEKLFLSLGLDLTQLDSDLLSASKTVNEGMSDLNRKAQQTKLKMEIDLSRFPDAEKSVEALTIKEKALTAQFDIQKQKVALVNAAYQESVAAKGAGDISSQKLLTRLLREQKAEADLAAQIQKTNATRAGLTGTAPPINTGSTISATNALNALTAAMGNVKTAGQSAGSGIMFLNTKMLALTAVAASGAGLFDLVKGAVAAGDAAYKLSSKLNLTVAETGNLNRILKMSDTDVQPFISTMIRLDKAVTAAGNGGNAVTDAMKIFDFTLVDTNKNLLPMNKQLEQLARGYENASKAGEEQAFITDVLGAKGSALVVMLENYRVNAEAASRVKSIGLDPKAMHEMAIEMKVLDMEAGQMKNVLGMALVPIARDIIPDIISGFDTAITSIKNNKDAIADSVSIVIELVGFTRDLGVALAEIPKFAFDLAGIHSAKDALSELKVEFELLKEHSVIDIMGNAIASKIPVLKDYVPDFKAQAKEQVDANEAIVAANKKAAADNKAIADNEVKVARDKASEVTQARQKEAASAKANAKANIELAAEVYKANHTQLENDLHDIDLRSEKLVTDGVQETVAAQISAARKKMVIDKSNADIKKSDDDLHEALFKASHSAVENSLSDIEKRRLAWVKSTKDEVAATALAEQEKRKLFQDTIDSELGEEFRAVKAAILAGKDKYAAQKEAHEKAMADKKAEREAKDLVYAENGIDMPGTIKKHVVIDGDNAYQAEEIMDKLTLDKTKIPNQLLELADLFGDRTKTAIETVIKNTPMQVGVVAQADVDSRATVNQTGTAGRELTVSVNNVIEIKGFTSDEIQKAVEQGAERTGKQIYDALQDAQSVMGVR